MYLKGMNLDDESKKNIKTTSLNTSSSKNNPTINNKIYAKKIDSIIYKDNNDKNNAVKFSFKKYIGKKISKLFNIGQNHMKDKKIETRKNSIVHQDGDLDSFLNNQQIANEYRDITDIYDKKINRMHGAPYEMVDTCLKSKKNYCFIDKLKKTISINNTDKLTNRKANFSIISVNLIMDNNKKISGKQLFSQILAAGLMYGDMSIFHRYYNNDGTGKILFSLANGMEPGSFNLEEFEDLQISALTFFMTIPGPDNLMQAFANMINTATIFADHFNVEMKDKDFCNITKQTIEHYRQCIRDFQRKQLLVKPTL